MNSRDRVKATINHQEPDRIPIDLGGTAASGINVNAYIQLKEWLGLTTDGIQIFDIFGMMARIEPDVIEQLQTDTLLVPSLCPRFGIPIRDWKAWQLFDGTPVQVPVGFETVADHDGSLLLMVEGRPVGRMPKTETYFLEMAEIDGSSLEELAHPPDPDKVHFSVLSEEDLNFRQGIAKHFFETTDKALIVDLVDNLRWNTPIANWLYAMAADPGRTYELHEKKSLTILESVKQLAQAVGPHVSVFAIYQDYGTQRGPLISPASFGNLVVPHYKRVFDWIHENTHWKVLFHSCGSIVSLIPLIIDMGADILNPVQCNTVGMEPQRLKEEFGSRIVFWGGGADTQTVLPFGTPEEVQGQVRERMAVFGPGGGYVFAPSQDIQADVPPQNLAAMYRAVREWGRYPLPATLE